MDLVSKLAVLDGDLVHKVRRLLKNSCTDSSLCHLQTVPAVCAALQTDRFEVWPACR